MNKPFKQRKGKQRPAVMESKVRTSRKDVPTLLYRVSGLYFILQKMIDGQVPGSGQYQGGAHSDCQQEEFGAFALLAAEPVHKEIIMMDCSNNTGKYQDQGKAPVTGKPAQEEGNWTKEFQQDHQESNDPGQPDSTGEIVHGSTEAKTAKPAQ